MGLRRWIACLPSVILWVATAAADTVHDGRGTFSGVEIVGFMEDGLAFRMSDGRVVSRPAATVKRIQVYNSNDRMAEVLTEAERLNTVRNSIEAIQRYRQVELNARTTWLQDFAAFRQAQLQDQLGAFPQALEAYMTLTTRVPQIAALVVPKQLPAPGTPEAIEAIDAIKAAERRSPPEEVAAVLVRLRHQVQTGKKFEEKPQPKPTTRRAEKDRDRTGERKSERSSTDVKPKKPAASSRPAEHREVPTPPKRAPKPTPASQPSVGRIEGVAKLVRQAISGGDLELAAKTVDRAKAYAKGADRPYWLLLNAELLTAQRKFDEAGLYAMRVVVEHPDSQAASVGLYWAAQAYEGLGRPTKAVELYDEASRHARVDETTRQAALARMKALAESNKAP